MQEGLKSWAKVRGKETEWAKEGPGRSEKRYTKDKLLLFGFALGKATSTVEATHSGDSVLYIPLTRS